MLLYRGMSDTITVPKKVKSVVFECCSAGIFASRVVHSTSS